MRPFVLFLIKLGKYLLISFFLISCTSNEKKIKSIVYTDYGSQSYFRKDFDKYKEIVDSYKLNTASFLYTCYLKNKKAWDIDCAGNDSPKLENIQKQLQYFKNKKIQTSLRFYLDLKTQKWRARLSPHKMKLFFKNYEEELVKFAKFAQSEKTDMLIIGCELEDITKPEFTRFWKKMISSVRKVYKGKISYSANGNKSLTNDREYEWVSFWHDLDFVSITYYPPVSKILKTKSEFKAHHLKNLSRLWRFKRKVSKDLVLAEVGFPLAKSGYQKPYEWLWPNTKNDRGEQVENLEAFLNAYRQFDFNGIYLWRFYPRELQEYPAGYDLLDEQIKTLIKTKL